MPVHLAMPIMYINVTNGAVPAKFINSSAINVTGYEWWRAFDGNLSDYWTAYVPNTINYLLVTFNDEYLLASLQLTIMGHVLEDPQTIGVYLDENATCMGQSFGFFQYGLPS